MKHSGEIQPMTTTFGRNRQVKLFDSFVNFDPDAVDAPLVVLKNDAGDVSEHSPLHKHACGQLVTALHGTVTCEIQEHIWMVPPQSALWIPSECIHRSAVSPKGTIYFLYIKPGFSKLPMIPCSLMLSPLTGELLMHIINEPSDPREDSANGRLAAALLEQLGLAAISNLRMPVPHNPQLRKIVETFLEMDCSSRRTISNWGDFVGQSERNLRRLVEKECGVTFGHWRRQLQIMLAVHKFASGATVREVSDLLGYNSPSSFIAMFKKMTGVTPRKHHQSRQVST